MRILIYGLNYAPELTGIGKYTGEMASWLAGRGHAVRVVTAPPYYPAWRIHEDYRRGPLYRTEILPRQPVVRRTPLYVPQNPTGLKRVAHLLSFMLGSFPVLLAEILHHPEIVLTVEPTFFGAPVALFAARASGAPAWLHVQDFEVDAAFELGLLPAGGLIQKFATQLERIVMQAFDCVSSISEKMLERTTVKGVPASRAILFPNWVDIDLIHPLTQDQNAANPIRRELAASVPDIQSKVIVLYSGNMGAKQGLELLPPLAEAFASDPRVHFVFCGDGAFRPQLEALVAGRQNVTLLPLQPLERLNALLNTADIHLLPQRADAADLVMPSRLTGMLSSGRPVIATAARGTQVAAVVAGLNAHEARGLVVPPEDLEALIAAIAMLANDADLRDRLGRAARAHAVEHLGKEQVLHQFETELLALARGPSTGREVDQ